MQRSLCSLLQCIALLQHSLYPLLQWTSYQSHSEACQCTHQICARWWMASSQTWPSKLFVLHTVETGSTTCWPTSGCKANQFVDCMWTTTHKLASHECLFTSCGVYYGCKHTLKIRFVQNELYVHAERTLTMYAWLTCSSCTSVWPAFPAEGSPAEGVQWNTPAEGGTHFSKQTPAEGLTHLTS